MKSEHLKILEKTVEIQTELDARNIDVRCYTAYQDDEPSSYHYLHKGGRFEFKLNDLTLDKVVELAEALDAPTFVSLKGKCVEYLEETVYVYKKIPVKLLSIQLDGVEVMYEDNESKLVSVDSLWIKT